jgi:hypothetical protein
MQSFKCKFTKQLPENKLYALINYLILGPCTDEAKSCWEKLKNSFVFLDLNLTRCATAPAVRHYTRSQSPLYAKFRCKRDNRIDINRFNAKERIKFTKLTCFYHEILNKRLKYNISSCLENITTFHDIIHFHTIPASFQHDKTKQTIIPWPDPAVNSIACSTMDICMKAMKNMKNNCIIAQSWLRYYEIKVKSINHLASSLMMFKDKL